MSAERALRVLHVVRPALGGMKEHVFELCRGLRERGHAVELACPADSEVAREAVSGGFEVHEIALVGPLRPISDVRGIVQVARIVRRGHYDLVHAHGFKAGLVARLGAALGGCRVRVVTVHGHVAYVGDKVGGSTKSVYRIAERSLSRMTSRIISVSDALRDELINNYGIAPDRIVTVHNGVDARPFLEARDGAAERARLGIPPRSPVVGTAARFAPQKGLRYFVDAAGDVASRNGDIVFVLGGDGPLAHELEDAITAAEATTFVRMPGFIADMPAFMAAVDVYVSPSLSEGLPLTLVQAGAAERPVVATRVGGTPEVVRDGISGLLVPPADASALAQAIERLIGNPALREQFGAEGRRIALTEFGPERMVERTLGVYQNALKGT